MKKRAQTQSLDLFTAIFIFLIVFIALQLTQNVYTERINSQILFSNTDLRTIMLSDTLLSTGKPKDWNASNVEIIGLTRYERHITSDRFEQLQLIPYNQTKFLLGLRSSDFYLLIRDQDTDEFITSYGNETTDQDKEIIALTRIVYYNDNLAKMTIKVWND